MKVFLQITIIIEDCFSLVRKVGGALRTSNRFVIGIYDTSTKFQPIEQRQLFNSESSSGCAVDAAHLRRSTPDGVSVSDVNVQLSYHVC